MTESLFSGLKVIDCASFIAAPAAATLLGDFGADVIKIEPPKHGDVYRHLPKGPGHPVSDTSYAWTLDARNKRSIALDLRNPEAQTVVHRLASTADVFITNHPLRSRARFAIDYEHLAPLNDQLIYASFTGYGERGDEANKPGFDVTAWWARSGMMDIVRADAVATPVRPVVGMGDHPAAVSLYACILTALYQRERTGKGDYVSSSLLANGIWTNSYLAQAALMGAVAIPRPPRLEALNALTSYYCCRDGKWLILTLLNEERDWPSLTNCLRIEHLIEDPRFITRADRHTHSVSLVTELDKAFAARDRDEWQKLLLEDGLIFEVVATPDDIPNDEQLVANEIVVPMEDPSVRTVRGPINVRGAAQVTPRRPPTVGEHTEAILQEAGFGSAEIEQLRSSGAVA